jgi:hypothetical protein
MKLSEGSWWQESGIYLIRIIFFIYILFFPYLCVTKLVLLRNPYRNEMKV